MEPHIHWMSSETAIWEKWDWYGLYIPSTYMYIYIVRTLSQVSRALSELHVQVREIVGRACEDTLAEHGFVPDPMEDPTEDMEGESSTESGVQFILEHIVCMSEEGEEKVLVQLDTKEKMTYTEQAAKRQHCQRLTRYMYAKTDFLCTYRGTHILSI